VPQVVADAGVVERDIQAFAHPPQVAQPLDRTAERRQPAAFRPEISHSDDFGVGPRPLVRAHRRRRRVRDPDQLTRVRQDPLAVLGELDSAVGPQEEPHRERVSSFWIRFDSACCVRNSCSAARLKCRWSAVTRKART
jgi:hypothetical protein